MLVPNSSYSMRVFYLKAFLLFQYLLDLTFLDLNLGLNPTGSLETNKQTCPPHLLSELGKACAAPSQISTSLCKRNENPVDAGKCWCIFFFPCLFLEDPGASRMRRREKFLYQHLVSWWCNERPGLAQRWPPLRSYHGLRPRACEEVGGTLALLWVDSTCGHSSSAVIALMCSFLLCSPTVQAGAIPEPFQTALLQQGTSNSFPSARNIWNRKGHLIL